MENFPKQLDGGVIHSIPSFIATISFQFTPVVVFISSYLCKRLMMGNENEFRIIYKHVNKSYLFTYHSLQLLSVEKL